MIKIVYDKIVYDTKIVYEHYLFEPVIVTGFHTSFFRYGDSVG